ncbi:MAG TPA: ABC transporter permease [Candidatus Nanopelagicales bacterium]|nr:ABC transporter permease [Candidatus Nanopelagicales bacterium]
MSAPTTVPTTGPQTGGPSSGAADYLYRRPRLRLAGLLSAPLLWLVVLYLGSLAIMFVAAFWTTDTFTGALIKEPTLANFQTLVQGQVYWVVALRTVAIALVVTVIDMVLAVPLAFFTAKVVRSRKVRYALVIAVTMPLWAGYLVKGYAMQTMFLNNGVIDWMLAPFGLKGPGLGLVAVTVSLAYLWLPYMVLPVYAGLERLPDSLLEASADLGAPAGHTFRSVVLPLLVPSLVAGSIFTFSLTLGDYIMVKIVGGSSQMWANIIYDNVGVANNLPLAAAAALFPVTVIVLYLLAVRRTGALENL